MFIQKMHFNSEDISEQIMPVDSLDDLNSQTKGEQNENNNKSKSGHSQQSHKSPLKHNHALSKEEELKKRDSQICKTILKHTLKVVRKRKKIVRRNQHPLMYAFTLIFTLFFGTENLYLFMWTYENRDIYIYLPSIFIRIAFFFLCSWRLCQNKKVLKKLYLSFDKVTLTIVAQTISVLGFCLINKTADCIYLRQWFTYLLVVFQPLLLFIFSGYFRVILVFANWKPSQTIVFKLIFLIGGAAYFGLATYYTILDINLSGNTNPETNQMISKLLILYAFAGFDYHLQSFALMEDIDGTGNCKFNYKLECKEEDMEILLYGGKIKKQNSDEQVNQNPFRKVSSKIYDSYNI